MARCMAMPATATASALLGSTLPQIGIIAPEDAMAACMTMDWTDAKDSIASAKSAAAVENTRSRDRIIGPDHRRAYKLRQPR